MAQERGIGAVDGQYHRHVYRRCQAGRQPPVGMNQIGTSGYFPLGSRTEGPPQADQTPPPHGAAQGSAQAVTIGVRVTQARLHPVHWYAVQLAGSGCLVTGCYDAESDATAHQGTGESTERGTTAVTYPTGKVVGEEDDPHQSVPNVGLLQPGQPSRDLAGLLPHSGNHFTQKAEGEQDDAADHHGFDQIQERPKTDPISETQDKGENAGDQSDHEEQ